MYLIPPDSPGLAGDILFYKPNENAWDPAGWFGHLIAFFTKSPVCHVEIQLTDVGMIGAHANGIRVSPLKPPAFRARLENAHNIAGGLLWAMQREGRAYDGFSIVSCALRVLGVPITLSGRGAYMCSEFAAHFLDFAGDDRVDDVLAVMADGGYENATPGDLLHMFQALDTLTRLRAVSGVDIRFRKRR